MCGLPLDICSEIFLRCSAQSLIRFRAVCKDWRAAIDDSCFVKTYTEQQQQLPSTTILIRSKTGHPFYPLYSFDLETLDFTDGFQSLSAVPLNITRDGLSRLSRFPAAACNGLMLIPSPYRAAESNWEIWNILTHERLQLPRLDSSVVRWSANGLGYDSATDDYKAVVIVKEEESKPPVYHTHVYSLRSDSWREITNFPCVDWRIAFGVGVFLGGALYWITYKGVVALDMKTESYRQLDLPPLHDRGETYKETSDRELGIHELSGCLMVSDAGTYSGCYKHFDLWVMMDNGTWMDLIASTRGWLSAPEFDMRPVAYTKNKMQFFMQDDRFLYLFDAESNSRKTVSIHGLLSEKVDTQAFQGSIFRLHDNCGRVINGGGSFSKKTGIKMTEINTDLIFCVRDDGLKSNSHYDCFCCYSSSEDEDEDEDEDEEEEEEED